MTSGSRVCKGVLLTGFLKDFAFFEVETSFWRTFIHLDCVLLVFLWIMKSNTACNHRDIQNSSIWSFWCWKIVFGSGDFWRFVAISVDMKNFLSICGTLDCFVLLRWIQVYSTLQSYYMAIASVFNYFEFIQISWNRFKATQLLAISSDKFKSRWLSRLDYIKSKWNMKTKEQK